MKRLVLVWGFLAALSGPAAAATITMDEAPYGIDTPLNGVVVGIATFGFNLDATFNSPAGPNEPGYPDTAAQNLDLYTIEGNAGGVLTISWSQLVNHLRFYAVLDTTSALANGFHVTLSNGHNEGVPVAPILVVSEGVFDYTGTPFNSATVTFDAVNGECHIPDNPPIDFASRCAGGRFALDNLSFDPVLDPTPAPVPEPSTLSLLGLGAAGLCLMRRRKAA
jgi:PEP-CTERM motif